MMTQELVTTLDADCTAARLAGLDAGKCAAGWIYLDQPTAVRLLAGMREGDPAVLDGYAAPNLSGEWAGESENEILGDILSAWNGPEGDELDARTELCGAWLDGSDAGFWDELERRAIFYATP